jgi:hypothetical protein
VALAKVQRRLSVERALLLAACAVMVAFAVHRLPNGFVELAVGRARHDGLDLRRRYKETHRWFSGQPAYAGHDDAIYPPATAVITWPLIGWPTFDGARIIWAVSSAAAIAGLCWAVVAIGKPHDHLHAVVLALVVPAAQATSLALGVGQLTTHALASSLLGLGLVRRLRPGLGVDGLIACLMVLALVKPTLTWPMVLLLLPLGRWRAFVLTCGGYWSLTALALAVRPESPIQLFRDWNANALMAAGYLGYGNLHRLLALAGHLDWLLPATAVVVAAFLAFAWRYRQARFPLLLGCAAVVTRVSTYHQRYDDLLLVLPLVALLHTAGDPTVARWRRGLATALTGLVWLALLSPGRYLFLGEDSQAFVDRILAGLWLVLLAVLLVETYRSAVHQPRAEADASASGRLTA